MSWKSPFVVPLEPEQIVRFWPAIAETLDRTPELWETTTKEWLREAALAGEFAIWMAGDGVEGRIFFTTKICERPAMKSYQVMIGAGEGLLENWDLLLESVQAEAEVEGCDEIEILVSRQGLVKLLREEGFSMREVTLTRRVRPAVLN